MNASRLLPRVRVAQQACSIHVTIRGLASSSSSSSSSPPTNLPLKFTKPTERLSPRSPKTPFQTPLQSSKSAHPSILQSTSKVFKASNPDHLPYQIQASKSGNIPVYHKHRKDGTIELTYVRKAKGDLPALAKDLCEYLKISKEFVTIKQLSGVLEVKGKRSAEIKEFFRLKGMGETYQSTLIARE
ncbi:hypothetical protein ABW19_dt0204143 [Dactylella cylindrospora]|nr:hypothetical protein ABW19_dt0204143 [Dactylella cylindrospora]